MSKDLYLYWQKIFSQKSWKMKSIQILVIVCNLAISATTYIRFTSHSITCIRLMHSTSIEIIIDITAALQYTAR